MAISQALSIGVEHSVATQQHGLVPWAPTLQNNGESVVQCATSRIGHYLIVRSQLVM